MNPEIDKYTYRISWSEEDQEFIGLCVEFPALSWLAPDPGEALTGIRSVIGECIQDLVRTGESAPAPISRRAYSGKFIVRVPPEVHRRLAVEAAESGVSLNRLVSARLAR